MDKKHINSIQALRAFAALSVVIFHYHDFLPFDADSVIGHFVFHGYFGVDMFFVISGFIAYYTVNNIDKNDQNLAFCYFIKRLARVIPLYYILTIISSNHTHEGFIQTAKSLAFIPSDLAYAGPSYGLPTVMQGWTLNYEMYFYLIVTCSFLFGKFKWFFIFTFIFMVISLPIILFGYPQKNYGYEGFYLKPLYLSLVTNPINIEFLLGIFAGMAHSRMDNRINFLWVAAIAASSLYFFMNFYHQFSDYSRVTAWGIPSAILTLALLKLERADKIKFPALILWIGSISFSIYLIHLNVIDAIVPLFSKIAPHSPINNVGAGLTIFFHLSDCYDNNIKFYL